MRVSFILCITVRFLLISDAENTQHAFIDKFIYLQLYVLLSENLRVFFSHLLTQRERLLNVKERSATKCMR